MIETPEQNPANTSNETATSLRDSSFILHPSSFDSHPSSVTKIFRLWLPLAVSFELMMLEGPAFQGAIGRLPKAPLNLAAWGLTMALSLIIESPIIMLLSTAIALVRDEQSYRALRRFMLIVCATCTSVTALVAFSPLFGFITGTVMGQPKEIVDAARPALRIMLFWTAAIGWRRFYQGILVRHGSTRLVSFGTAVRLLTAISTAVALVRLGGIPGVQVAAICVMAAVTVEALVTTAFAIPMIRRDVETLPPFEGPALTQRSIMRFHGPLAATTLLTLFAQPMTAAALARLAFPKVTLAAWPVTFMVLLVIRGGGLALQEITIAQYHEIENRDPLRKFAWILGWISTVFTGLVVVTPLLDLYLSRTLRLPFHLQFYAHVGVSIAVLLPLVTALSSWARGAMVARGDTRYVYRGMGVSLGVQSGLLVLGVILRLPGMWTASLALTIGGIAEYVYLARTLPSKQYNSASN